MTRDGFAFRYRGGQVVLLLYFLCSLGGIDIVALEKVKTHECLDVSMNSLKRVLRSWKLVIVSLVRQN